MLGKVMAGCGCIGLILSVLTLVAGGFMLAMMNDSHLSELGPFGVVVTPIGAVLGLVSLVLLGIGVFMSFTVPAEK